MGCLFFRHYPLSIMRRLSPISIGPLTIDMPVVLAPMTGVTDMPFRTLVRRYGCGLNVTEMIATAAMIRETRQSLQKAAWHPLEEPVSLLDRAAHIDVDDRRSPIRVELRGIGHFGGRAASQLH